MEKIEKSFKTQLWFFAVLVAVVAAFIFGTSLGRKDEAKNSSLKEQACYEDVQTLKDALQKANKMCIKRQQEIMENCQSNGS